MFAEPPAPWLQRMPQPNIRGTYLAVIKNQPNIEVPIRKLHATGVKIYNILFFHVLWFNKPMAGAVSAASGRHL